MSDQVMLFEHEVMGEVHTHEYPGDWEFGGADGADPRMDARWEPTTYTYYGADVSVLWVTQIPLCDDEALEYFEQVATIAGSRPKWVAAKRPGVPLEMLPWIYNVDTDEVTPNATV